jgi:signal transduction histidine kinase
MRRLYLQIYLHFLGVTAAIVVLSLLAGRLVLYMHGSETPRALAAAELLAEHLPTTPAGQAAALTELGARLDIMLELRDREGALLAATPDAELPLPEPGGSRTQWSRAGGEPSVVVRLADGRWVAAGIRRDPEGWYFIHYVLLIGSIAVMIAGFCYPLARRISRRVEELRRGVEGFGAGDLGVRVQVVGRDEVAALAIQFNRAADRIEALVAGQRRMVASASHELRSPLARLRLAIELLADAAPQQRALASEAARDIEELDELVGDLLLSSALEARPPVRERHDLAATLREECGRAGAKDMSEGTAMIEGDPAALRRLIRNLLENARRHGGGAVEVRVEATGEGWRICVDDRGPGVPEAERERIFTAFYRPPGHREGDGGVGLGLALVRQIAEKHGGTARCEARPGGGGRFVVELPRGASV